MTSWVLALCVTPTLCYFFIKPVPTKDENTEISNNKNEPSSFMDKLYLGYEKLLHWLLEHKTLFLTAMIGLLFASVFSMKFVAQQFFLEYYCI